MLRAVLFVLFALAAVAFAACNDDRPEPAVRFLQGNGTLITGSSAPVTVAFTIDDVTFFGPAGPEDSDDILDLSMRSVDNLTWLSLQLLDVKGEGDHPLDSGADGRLILLFGPECEEGQGDLMGGDCRWYSTEFPGSACTAHLDDASRETVVGRVVCESLGVYCPRGVERAADGTCLAGEHLAPLEVSLTFRLTQPASTAP